MGNRTTAELSFWLSNFRARLEIDPEIPGQDRTAQPGKARAEGVEHAAMQRNRTLELPNIQHSDKQITQGHRVHHRPRQYGPREQTTHQELTSTTNRQETPPYNQHAKPDR